MPVSTVGATPFQSPTMSVEIPDMFLKLVGFVGHLVPTTRFDLSHTKGSLPDSDLTSSVEGPLWYIGIRDGTPEKRDPLDFVIPSTLL